jgi:hypothetical protein
MGGAARRAEAAADFGPDGFGVAPAEDDAKAAHVAQARFRLGVRGPPPPLAANRDESRPIRLRSIASVGDLWHQALPTWYHLVPTWYQVGSARYQVGSK